MAPVHYPGIVVMDWLRRYRILVESVLVAVVAVVGGLCVWPVFQALGPDQLEGRFSVVLHAFSAPTMFAAGRGMQNIDLNLFPELLAFYRNETSSFDVALIPEEYEGYPINDSYSYMHFYLLYAIGLAWRFFGISFLALHLLCTVLFAVMITVLYGIFRLAMGRLLSVAGALLAAASPAYLMSCPSLRDFGKAPFILGCFLLLGWLLKHKFTPRRLWAWSAAYALTAAIGYGFRQDLLICVPAGIAVTLFFAQVDAQRHIRARCIASVIMLVLFLVVASPVTRGVRLDRGSASAQAFTQGVSVAVENKQRFGHASYIMHADYSDYYDFTIVNHYARRQGDTTFMPAHFNEGHGQAGSRYMREVMRRFPGDMFARGLASLAALPGANRVAGDKTVFINQDHGELLRHRADVYAPLAEHMERWGMAYTILALVVLSASNIRIGMSAAFLGVYFGAYPSLLYDFRHYFHLAFVPYWAIGYLLTQAARCVVMVVKAARRRRLPHVECWLAVRKTALALAFLLVFVAALWTVATMARMVQQRQVRALLAVLEEAELEPVATEWTREDTGWLLEPVETLPEFKRTGTLPGFESTGEYLVASLTHTGFTPVVRLLYEDRPMVNFSEFIHPHPGIVGAHGSYRYFFPAYELTWPYEGPEADPDNVVRGRFRGLFVPDGQRERVRGLYRIKNADRIPLWPHVALAEDRDAFFFWKTGPLDRFLAAARVEACSFFGLRRAATVRGYMQLLRRWPDHAFFQGRVIETIRRMRDPERAFNMVALLVQDFPQLRPLVDRELGDLMQEMLQHPDLKPSDYWSMTMYGEHLEQQERFEEARDMYYGALELAPEFALAAQRLDGCYARAGDGEGRLRLWREMHQRHPEACVPQFHLGITLRQQRHLEEAEQHLAAIVDKNLHCQDEAMFHLAATLIMKSQREQGMDMLEGALEKLPTRLWLAAGLHAEIGRFMAEQGDYETAMEHFRLAMNCEPENLWHRVGLADIQSEAGDVNAAAQEYFAVLSQAPESPYSAHKLDELLIAWRDADARMDRWRQLADAHPDAAVPRLYLGKALYDAGDHDGARRAYRDAVERNPELDEARARLENLELQYAQ